MAKLAYAFLLPIIFVSATRPTNDSWDELLPYVDNIYTNPTRMFNLRGDAMETLQKVMQCCTNVWSLICNLFGSSRSSEIKGKLEGIGFTTFDSATQVQILAGIKESALPIFEANIIKRFGLNPERVQQVKNIVSEVQGMDSNTWVGFDFLFSIDNGGEIKYCALYGNHSVEENKYNFLVVETFSTFKLAPDLLVITKKLSILGGLWSNQEEELVEIPRTFNKEDINTAMYFFNIISLKRVAQIFFIDLPLPK